MTLKKLLEEATEGEFHSNNCVVLSDRLFPDPQLKGSTNHIATMTRQQDADEYVYLHNHAAAFAELVEVAKARPNKFGPYYMIWLDKMDAALRRVEG